MSPEIKLAQILLKKKLTLGTAESCTGGRMAGLITSVPGSSAYFNGGIVSYSNEIKHSLLGVSQSDLDSYGAVSEQVVVQMSKGARQALKSDCAIATSGIAGPDGGTPDKPVGTVWIAVSYKETTAARRFQFSGNREENMLSSANSGINMLLDLVSEI
ncbi:MAG: CinA family protein [Dysgonamonadaceae bacterium]|jgi:nicotinamide-nucleotide amidase|nr:CinA family protein [Dysgonamonadaceae bacterium]